MPAGSVVLSTLEFDVAWELERLPAPHASLTVPSPGRTHTERADLVRRAMATLRAKGLAEGDRVTGDLADLLALLANPTAAVDGWVWTDHQISALAVAAGSQGLLAVVDGAEVWLIPSRPTAIGEAAVSVAGEMPAGPGESVSVPTDLLTAADTAAGGDPHALIMALESRGLPLTQAQQLAGMTAGMHTRGQFGVRRTVRGHGLTRAERVIAFHDTPRGRYLYLTRTASDGRSWSTLTPADNPRITAAVTELLETG